MPKFLLWVIVTGFNGFLSSYAKPHFCITERGHEHYDDSVNICCNGEIKLRVRNQECCGDVSLYFINVSICCGGRIEDRFVPPRGSLTRSCSSNDELCHEQTCCGGIPVDKESTMCCQEQSVHLNHTQQLGRDFLQCCGNTVINGMSYSCCGGNKYFRHSTLECCDGKVIDKQAERCLINYEPPRIVGKYEDFCGDLKYDMRNRSCCSGTIHDVPAIDPLNPRWMDVYFSCCDAIAYDSRTTKCCRESNTGFSTHIIDKLPNIYCCGDGFYNALHQDCYKGTALQKVAGKTRCGYTYIDGETEKCCGDVAYNTQTHECCTGDHTNVISKDDVCCNGLPSNDTVLCCDSITTSVKRRPDDDECCYNYNTEEAQTFNSKKNEHCVQGHVTQVPENAMPCGLLNFYFAEYQICCGEKVYNISTGFDSCCGDKPYKSPNQQCCNYEISNISPQEGNCCSKDLKVYRFDDRDNPCIKYCGSVTYDDDFQICCQGVVHDFSEPSECCGSSVIRSSREACCGDLFPRSIKGDIRCCRDRELFNKRHAKCQNGKVVPTDPELKNLKDVQYLCSPSGQKHFDGGARHACESEYIIKARLINVTISERTPPKGILIKLNFTGVTAIDRGAQFKKWSSPRNIVFTITVPRNTHTHCKKRYFTKFCKVIIFFNGNLNAGNVNINKHSTFLMTKHSRKRERLITKTLNYEYCKKNFNVR